MSFLSIPMQTLFFSMVRTRCTTLRVGAAKDCEFFFLYSFIWSGLIIIIIIIIEWATKRGERKNTLTCKV